MKKITIVMICLLLMAAITMSVLAEGTLNASLTPEKTTVNRGDSILVTLALTEEVTCKSGSVRISIDSSVFERSGNAWLLTGTTMADPNGDAVFSFSQATAISGDIYQFTLTAKSSAAFADSQVSAALTLRDANGTESKVTVTATVTVACVHSFGDWTQVDGTNHKRTCSVCKEAETAAHNWGEGEVTAEATCQAQGSITYTCADCGATKTESVPKKEHSYDEGVITVEASCTAEGEKTYTCTACGTTKTETVAVQPHSYDNDCDPDCNYGCGTTRETSHSYSTGWSADGESHWHACTGCGDRQDEEAHTPGTEATEWTAQTCTVCGHELQAALGHTHNFKMAYVTNSEGHWYACTGCNEKKNYGEHWYSNACDVGCNTCNYFRETEHNYSTRWTSDAEGHWYGCTVCGDVLEKYPHIPGPEATEDTDQICTDCGFVIQPAGNHVHEPTGDWLSDALNHWHQCACGQQLEDAGHTWDEGTVDEEAGVITYRCTVCGYPKMRALADGPDPTEPTGGSQTTPPPQSQNPGDAEPDDGFPWWILGVVLGVLLLGGIVFVIIGVVVSKKQTGKYTG